LNVGGIQEKFHQITITLKDCASRMGEFGGGVNRPSHLDRSID